MHVAGVNQSPAIAKTIRVVAFDVEALLGLVLKNRNSIVAALDQEVDGLRTQQRRIKAIEEDGTAPALRVPDLSGEDRFLRGIAASIKLKVFVAEAILEKWA